MAVRMHLAHATILGTLFQALLILSQTPVLLPLAVVYGVLYSIVLWTISPYLTRRLFEKTGEIRITTKGLTTSLLTDILYGVIFWDSQFPNSRKRFESPKENYDCGCDQSV